MQTRQEEKLLNSNRHYSLRKLSVGLASVLIGISFLNGTKTTVKADTIANNNDKYAEAHENNERSESIQDALLKNTDVAEGDSVHMQSAKNVDTAGILANTSSVQSSSAAQNSSEITKSFGLGADKLKKSAQSSNTLLNVKNSNISTKAGEVSKAGNFEVAGDISSAQNSVAKPQQNNLLDDLGKQKASAENNQAEAKNQENRLADQINYKLTNQDNTDNKKDLGQNKVAPDETKSTPTTKSDAEKSIAGSSLLQESNNQSNDHAEDNSQTQTSQKLDLTKNSKKLAKKVLATNLIETNSTQNNDWADPARGVDPVKFASNGGFDPKIWGTMDTSKWQLDNDGNITGYTGDMSHIIIPNASDFAKAGKSYQQIGISSDEMQRLGGTANFGVNTLAISLTDNKKVKATNADWSFVFSSSTLKQANLEGLDTGNVTNMGAMFNGASNLTSLDVSNWNTGNVTDMHWMFDNASNLTSLDVSKWDTSKVTNMISMFSSDLASSLKDLDVSNWDTGNVTRMSDMFNNASSLTSLDVSNWDTGNVTNMQSMFAGTSSLTSLDVSNWDTSQVTFMDGMFAFDSSLTSLDVSNWDTRKVTFMNGMFWADSSLTNLDVSNWDTGNVTDMSNMFNGASGLKNLDVSKWNTGNVTDMRSMFNGASGLKNLDVSNWDTGNVTRMSDMFNSASSLTNLDVSKWDTGNVTKMSDMFNGDLKLALIVNGDKFADYLVKNKFMGSKINSDVKSVTTDNTKLLKLLTNDVGESESATRTIVFTFPVNYSPDLTKYHLTKIGNTYQIKQSADYDKPYLQGTVLINATGDITEHHIDTTKPNEISSTWQPNYDKLVLAHKNADGTVSFDKVQLPKVPGYKAKVTRNNGLLMVNYLVFAPEKPATNNNLNELQFSNRLATNSTIQFDSAVKSNIVVKSDMYQVVNDDHNWQLPVIKSYDLKFATNKNQIIFAYTKDKQYNYRFVLTFKDGQYRLTTFNKQGKLLKTYSIKSYKKLAKIIHSLVLMNIA